MIEVPKIYVKKYGSIEKAINEGYYINWDEEDIKEGFKNGNGTMKDFKSYMENNKRYCYYVE